MASRLLERYKAEIKPVLEAEFSKNKTLTAKIDKVVISVGAGEAMKDTKLIQNMQDTISLIAGQKAVKVIAKKSVAGFKVREGMPVGIKVTLRGEQMYHFLDKLCNIALPRVKDFRGLNKNGFDGRGNYTLGIREQIVFPEIEIDKVDKMFGLGITIVSTAKTDEEARDLLDGLGFPFRK